MGDRVGARLGEQRVGPAVRLRGADRRAPAIPAVRPGQGARGVEVEVVAPALGQGAAGGEQGDGAQNESGWTATRSFRVGFLPLWAFILIIAVAVVLLILLIRALIIKRTIYYDGW